MASTMSLHMITVRATFAGLPACVSTPTRERLVRGDQCAAQPIESGNLRLDLAQALAGLALWERTPTILAQAWQAVRFYTSARWAATSLVSSSNSGLLGVRASGCS